MNLAKRAITRRLGVSVQTAELMMQAGMTSPGNIAELTDEQLRELTGLGPREIRARLAGVEPFDHPSGLPGCADSRRRGLGEMSARPFEVREAGRDPLEHLRRERHTLRRK